jgi:hypothetical protein
METDYKILDFGEKDTLMSDEIFEQLYDLYPRPGDVIGIKCDSDSIWPFLVVYDPFESQDGFLRLIMDIDKRLRVQGKVDLTPDGGRVEIGELDALNMDIDEGFLTAEEAYEAYQTKELPQNYIGYLSDPEDREEEEWKIQSTKFPSYKEWCTNRDFVNTTGVDIVIYDCEKVKAINDQNEIIEQNQIIRRIISSKISV